jgi:DNA polymerase (family 10)
MKPQDAADALTEIATLLEVRGENPFKSRAFSSAARTLQGMTEPEIDPLVRSGAIADLPGIGQTTLAVLNDLVATGDAEYLDLLRETTPEGLVEMLRIPGMGPTRIHRVHTGLGIETVAELEAAARDGRLASQQGFGVKTAAAVLRGIASLREKSGQIIYSLAIAEARKFADGVAALPGVVAVEIAGSLRRACEIVRDIDLVVGCTADPHLVASAAAHLSGVSGVIDGGGASPTLRLANGVRCDVYCVPADRVGIARWLATGSRDHCTGVIARLVERGFDLRDERLIGPEGAAVGDATEEAVYRAASLAFVPVELREGLMEIELAASGSLPRLIEASDVRGALHCHSNYSDGTTTIRAMALAAQARGWSYLGISDHSQSAFYAGGLDLQAIARQHEEIDRLNEELEGFRVLKGIEADILADGTVDYASDVLDRFDYVIASVHSRFSMGRAQMTERILRAMDDPRVTILGHPTGRLLLTREPYPVDIPALIDRAVETGIALELNCDPHRLDLDWRWLQVARARGATIELGPDAHSPSGLGYIDHGLGIARKGWLTAADVLNAGSADDVLAFARRRRATTPGSHGG